MPLSLHEWETFYVITGSSGAALTGLMFVVIALAAERFRELQRGRPTEEMSTFSTPNVVHFGVVLLIASIMTIPHTNVVSLGVGLVVCTTVGLAYNISSMLRMRRLKLYTAVTEDWIWHIILPFVAYLSLLVSVGMLGVVPETALYLIAGVVLLLLLIGIHNAWDVALYTATQANPLDFVPPQPSAGSGTPPSGSSA